MAKFAAATTAITIKGGLSVPEDEYKKVEGQSPEFSMALARFFDSSQAFADSYITDPPLREDYRRRIRAAADEMMDKVKSGELTPHEGAQQANAMRNQILKFMRDKSTTLGRSVAEKIKPTGKTMNDMQEKYATRKYGKAFDSLSEAERGNVWAAIVDSAGRSNPNVDMTVRYYGVAGKTFLVASLAVAVYDIYNAKDKVRETAKEATSIGSAIALGAAVTAGLGLATVSAPVVFMAVFVAGVVGSTGSGKLFDYFWPER